jgi:hypothetical protein
MAQSKGRHALMVLSFVGGILNAVRFQRTPGGATHRVSRETHAGHVKIFLGSQVCAILLHLLHQALWVARDAERADREVAAAVEIKPGVAIAESSHVWRERPGRPYVRTAAEALNRRCYNRLVHIFGTDLNFVQRSFVISRGESASVGLNCLVFDPRGIEVRSEGKVVTDPDAIMLLMKGLARTRGWDLTDLLDETPEGWG